MRPCIYSMLWYESLRIKKKAAGLILAAFFLFCLNTTFLFSQDEGPKGESAAGSGEPVVPKEAIGSMPAKAEPINTEEIIAKINEAKDAGSALRACESAIQQCKAFEDYENMISEIKLLASMKDYAFQDVLDYAVGKARVEELSYLTKKNDIESGRIYMSVNEKYYNEALEYLDKAGKVTKSKDLDLGIYFLKFLIFKEIFQPQKVDGVFNEMVNKVGSYSEEDAKNLAKLNEISNKLSDNGMKDDAMKLKLVYASKVDPNSAKKIADEIKTDADKYFEAGSAKEAVSTYDTYLQLAENYYDKDAMSARLMDIAEKYFNKSQYKYAIKYYSLYLFKYGASQVADYASSKLAMSYYHDKDYAKAVSKFEEFLNTYPNSVWFEKGFESLCKLYYENSSAEKAQEFLQKLIDTYPRRETRDYAHLLIGTLYYSKADYNKALEIFKKIQQSFPKSAYLYTTDVLIADINDIKKGGRPSYSFGSKDIYKAWDIYTQISADIGIGEGAEVVDNKDAKPGEIFIKTKAGSKVTFTINGLEDLDRFHEYWQDREDQSRLPREIKTETEKDLIFLIWSGADGGKFLDDKQTLSRIWRAPGEPGNCAITINIGDLGLVRPLDTGSRKDAAKTLSIHVFVEK